MIERGKSFLIEENKFKKGITPFEMIWIRPGEFVMGVPSLEFSDGHNEEMYVMGVGGHTMAVTQGFWLGKYMVSQAHWKQICGNLEFACKNKLGRPSKNKLTQKEDQNLPIYGITWLEAINFCRLLNVKYKEYLPEGYHFSLPTEVQWEYACKANQEETYVKLSFNEFVSLENYNNIKEIGSIKPNAWGLHGMLNTIPEYTYDISAYSPGFEEEYNDDEEKPPIINDKYIDWVGNLLSNDWTPVLNNIEYQRIIKGYHMSSYREYRVGNNDFLCHYNIVSFRVALRPIINYPNCDLDDPVYKKEGINILGD